MTKISSWVCDICKTEFKSGDPGYEANTSLDINIPSAGMGEWDENFHFTDTCYNCRVNLSIAINGLIIK